MKFRYFPDISKFPKILIRLATRENTAQAYTMFFLSIITLCFTCGEKKML